MPTETDTEDTLTVRTEKVAGYFKLGTLNVGDEFETESSGGKVAWVIRNGAAQAVGVVFDGHTTDISVAPSMLVKLRKLAPIREDIPVQQAIEEAAQQCAELADDLVNSSALCEFCDGSGAVDSGGVTPWGAGIDVPCVCRTKSLMDGYEPEAEQALFDDAAFDPITAHPLCEDLAPPVSRSQAVGEALRVLISSPKALEQPKPAPPTIRIIQLAEPEPVAKVAADPTLPVCTFDLTLNEQQIGLLHFSSATDLFCRGLYFSWTKDTFFAVAKKHFPGLKCGQDREACMRQIALYRATLRKAGKLG